MDLGATVCRPRAPRCGECPVRGWCAAAAAGAAPDPARPAADRAGSATRPRFADTNRWARGRVVASLAAGDGLPPDVPPERLERALAGLERDGLVVRAAAGAVALPG